MKKMSKIKYLAVILALVISVANFAGCSKKEAEDSSSTNVKVDTAKEGETEDTKGDEEEKKLEPVELEWLAYDCYEQPNPDGYFVKLAEEKFNAKFKFWFIDSNKEDALNVKLVSGEMPDVMRVKSIKQVGEYARQGILAEVTEETIRKYAPNYADMVDRYDQDGMAWKIGSYNGKHYTLPRVNKEGNLGTVLIWREDWLDKLGITKIPETLVEYEEAMYKMAQEDPDGDGKDNTYGMSDTTMPAIFGAFGLYMDPLTKVAIGYMMKDDKVIIPGIEPEAKEALKILRKWYLDGVIDPEFVTKENDGGYWGLSHAFMNSRVGITGNVMYYHYLPESVGAIGGCLKEALNVNPDIKVAYGDAPIGPTGLAGTPRWGAMGESYGITIKGAKDERKVETILKIFDALVDPEQTEYAKKMIYGEEGKEYIIEDGIKTSIEGGRTRKDGLSVFGSSSPDLDLGLKASNFADEVSPKHTHESIKFPSGEMMTKYASQLGKMKQEAFIEIITGGKDIDYFDTYVESFLKNGGNEVLEEVNAIYESMK